MGTSLTSRPRSRRARWGTFWAAAGLSLLVAHDAVFLLQVGPGRQLTDLLRNAGHGYWPVVSWALVLGAVAGAAWWAVRLARLWRAARGLRPPAPETVVAATWRSRVLRLWPRLLVTVTVAFVLQENLEHAIGHGHWIGIGALVGPEYPLAIPVLAAVSALAASIAALVRHAEAQLVRRIAAARLALARPARRLGSRRPPQHQAVHRDPLALHRAGRAPPYRFLPA